MRKRLIRDGLQFLAFAAVVGTAALLASGCAGEPQSTTKAGDFRLEFLFEHEGVRVFRFQDAGRYIYYTDARGAVEWKGGGKHPVINRVETSK